MARIRTVADLGGVVRGARQRAGLTQDELATQVGVSRTWLSKVENGHARRAEFHLVLSLLGHLGLGLSVDQPAPSTSERRTAAVDLGALLDQHRST